MHCSLMHRSKQRPRAKLHCPTMALWGSEFEAAKMVDMAEIWRGFAEDLTTAPIVFAGHLPRCPLVTQP
jgi:haloacetate dehalogenase